jgi:hypothetical protein
MAAASHCLGPAAPRALAARRTPRTPPRAPATHAPPRPHVAASVLPGGPGGRTTGISGINHQLYSHLRIHRQRLEQIVQAGAASATDLAPVVSELRCGNGPSSSSVCVCLAPGIGGT